MLILHKKGSNHQCRLHLLSRLQAIGLSIEALEESEEKLRQGACVALTVLQVCWLSFVSTSTCPTNISILAVFFTFAFGRGSYGSGKTKIRGRIFLSLF